MNFFKTAAAATFVALAACLASLIAPAVQAEEFELQTTLKNLNMPLTDTSGTLNIDLDVYISMRTMFGDPVWYCTARWRFNELTIANGLNR